MFYLLYSKVDSSIFDFSAFSLLVAEQVVWLTYPAYLFLQEKQLQVGMGIKKLRQKVKEQQERVGQKVCGKWKHSQFFVHWSM
jgi:hypothetical protein